MGDSPRSYPGPGPTPHAHDTACTRGRRLNRKDSTLYVVNGAIMALTFFLLRVVLMGWLVVRNLVVLRAPFFALPPSTVVVTTLGCAVGYPMQLMWFSKIVSGIVKILSGTPASKLKSYGEKKK